MRLSEKFIDFRARHNLSQQELAELLGFSSRESVCRIECEKHTLHRARELRLTYALAELENKMKGIE